jgi:hypothetical protein
MTSENDQHLSFMNMFATEKVSTRLCRGCRKDGTQKMRRRPKGRKRKDRGKNELEIEEENDLRNRFSIDNADCSISAITIAAASLVCSYERTKVAKHTVLEIVLPTAVLNVMQRRQSCASDAAHVAASAAVEAVNLVKSTLLVASEAKERAALLTALNQQLDEANMKLALHAQQLTEMEKRAMAAVAETQQLKDHISQQKDDGDTGLEAAQHRCGREGMFSFLAPLRFWSGCLGE